MKKYEKPELTLKTYETPNLLNSSTQGDVEAGIEEF